MKPKIFVTRKLPSAAMEKLEEFFHVSVNPEDRVLSRDEIRQGMQECDILLPLLTDTIDAEMMRSAPSLKGISNYAVGFNNIDVEAATELGLPVCNTPGVLTDATADLTWALLMAVTRRVVEADQYNRAGKFQGWAPLLFLGADIYGKTLGIIGTGRIGSAVAHRATGFKLKILYHDHKRNEALEKELKAEYVPLNDLLRTADFVTLHVPLLPETTELIGEKELRSMQSTAYLINTSRGKVVNETALVKALQEGWIAGAGLDVYYNEPELHPGLKECPNTVLLPHIASATTGSRTAMGMLAAENAIAIIKGEKPPHIVNPEVLNKQ
ncbi:MAG: D-glycerate dehydrogenase [Candidatus Cloacimonas sp. SDB]|nr:MAG: D-glycerate dehydrogenase [Candidatus Cloacimonas sp. SDB]